MISFSPTPEWSLTLFEDAYFLCSSSPCPFAFAPVVANAVCLRLGSKRTLKSVSRRQHTSGGRLTFRVWPVQTLVLGPAEAPVTVAVPPTTVTWSTAYTQPSENFTGSAWEIHLPVPFNTTAAGTLVFATGVEFVLPSTINVAGGATPALYTATFEATVQLMTVQWQFAATSYPPNYLPVDYNALNVVITGPLAGTPQVNPAGAQGPTSVAGPPQTAAPICQAAPPPAAAGPPPPPAPLSVPAPPPPPPTVPSAHPNCTAVMGVADRLMLPPLPLQLLVPCCHDSGRFQSISS